MLTTTDHPGILPLSATHARILARARCPEEGAYLVHLFADPTLHDLDPLRPIPLYLEDPITKAGEYLATLVLTATYCSADGEWHAELCRAVDTPETALLRRLFAAQTGVEVRLV